MMRPAGGMIATHEGPVASLFLDFRAYGAAQSGCIGYVLGCVQGPVGLVPVTKPVQDKRLARGSMKAEDRSPTLLGTGFGIGWGSVKTCFMTKAALRLCLWPFVFRDITPKARIFRPRRFAQKHGAALHCKRSARCD
jgi:hypothetical protein